MRILPTLGSRGLFAAAVLASLVLASSRPLFAQNTGVIKGQVIVSCAEEDEGAKLSLVYIPGRSFLVVTGKNGKFRMDNLPPRAAGYTVRIQDNQGNETDVLSPPVASGQVVTLSDLTTCHCGNEIQEDDSDTASGVEECDGSDLNEETCQTVDSAFTGGTLACNQDCTFNISGCTTD